MAKKDTDKAAALNEQKLLGQARHEADTTLKANHSEEWADLMREAANARGVVWKPRASAEERAAAKQAEERAKAQAKLEALLEKHPELRDTFAPVAAENQVDQDSDEVHATV